MKDEVRPGYCGASIANSATLPLQKQAFLKTFAMMGVISFALKKENNGLCDIKRSKFYEWLKKPQFKEEYRLAGIDATEVLERECIRRAVEGVTVKSISRDGQEISKDTKYSDGLLTFLLKARAPHKYRENVSIQHTGKDQGPIQTAGVNVNIEADPGNTANVLKILADLGVVQPTTDSSDDSKDE